MASGSLPIIRTAKVCISAKDAKCQHHSGKDFVFICLDDDELACISCVSTLHLGHSLMEIDKLVPQYRKTIQDHIYDIRNDYIPRLESRKQDICNMLQKNDLKSKEVTRKIIEHNEDLKRELDRNTSRLLTRCKLFEIRNKCRLSTSKTIIETTKQVLEADVEDCQNILQSNRNIAIYNHVKALEMNYDLSATIPPINFLQFHPDETERSNGHLMQSSETGMYSEAESLQVFENQIDNCSLNLMDHFPVTRITRVSYLRTMSNTGAWLHDFGTKTIKQINTSGQILHEVTIEDSLHSDFSNISFSPITGKLWMSGGSYCGSLFELNDINSQTFTKRFAMPVDSDIIRSVCLTRNSTIIIGSVGLGPAKVAVFTLDGHEIDSTLTDKNESLMGTPFSIAECHVTGNIAVVHNDYEYHPRERTNVTIRDSKLRFIYLISSASESTESRIFPTDLCYDQRGNLLISTYDSILLFSGIGQFLKVLYRFKESSWLSISFLPNHTLWVNAEMKHYLMDYKIHE